MAMIKTMTMVKTMTMIKKMTMIKTMTMIKKITMTKTWQYSGERRLPDPKSISFMASVVGSES